jgi:hypothetical protein
MAYGRICRAGEKTFLREAILTVLRKHPCIDEKMPPLCPAEYKNLRREVYRAQIGSKAGKEVRWQLEKALSEQFSARYFSRNQLLNEEVEVYQERNADRVDMLHEYLIPAERVAAFLERARSIIPKHPVDLLNATVRKC